MCITFASTRWGPGAFAVATRRTPGACAVATAVAAVAFAVAPNSLLLASIVAVAAAAGAGRCAAAAAASCCCCWCRMQLQPFGFGVGCNPKYKFVVIKFLSSEKAATLEGATLRWRRCFRGRFGGDRRGDQIDDRWGGLGRWGQRA